MRAARPRSKDSRKSSAVLRSWGTTTREDNAKMLSLVSGAGAFKSCAHSAETARRPRQIGGAFCRSTGGKDVDFLAQAGLSKYGANSAAKARKREERLKERISRRRVKNPF